MGSPSSPPPASTSWSTSSFRSRVRSPRATSPQHLLRTSHSWRSRLTRRTWPPPSTSSSSPSRSSTPASSSTQSSAQSERNTFPPPVTFQQPKPHGPKAPVITNFYYS